MFKFIYFIYFFYILNIFVIKKCQSNETYLMPDESEPHSATWMAYGATVEAWGERGPYSESRSTARKDLIRIAVNLARFEKVKMLVNLKDEDEAFDYLKNINGTVKNANTANIEFIRQPINDLWMRDTGPIFVYDKNKNPCGINFNFNGWGQENTGAVGWKKSAEKQKAGVIDQRIVEDRLVADFIIERTGVKKIKTWLVIEGGGVEVNGKGTAICTESCIINDNRNPGKSKSDVEKELFRLLGVKKVIWLRGLKDMDVTDGHIDFYARFVSDTNVAVSVDNNKDSPDYNITQENLSILQKSTDAQGNSLTIIPLYTPNSVKVEEAVKKRNDWKSTFNKNVFASGYVGFYVANNCIIMSEFGDESADKAAFSAISKLYPKRTIIQITTDGIANGGGSIHCSTQQQISGTNVQNASFCLISFILLFFFLFSKI